MPSSWNKFGYRAGGCGNADPAESALRWASAFELTGAGQQGLDGLVAQHPQGGQAARAFRRCLVAMGLASLANHLLASQFLQIVGRLPGAVLARRRASQGVDLSAEFRGGKSPGGHRKRQDRLHHPSHPKLVEIHLSHPRLTHLTGLGQLLQEVVGNEASRHPLPEC